MYPLSHQIQKAMHIAQQESEASVGVICNWQDAKVVVETLLSTGQFRGVMKWQTRTFVSESGSIVRFLGNTPDEVSQACMGYSFSHVFVKDVWDAQLKSYINSRVRSAKSFKEPLGYYDEFGVQRYEDY